MHTLEERQYFYFPLTAGRERNLCVNPLKSSDTPLRPDHTTDLDDVEARQSFAESQFQLVS